jgi:hypothetical protein
VAQVGTQWQWGGCLLPGMRRLWCGLGGLVETSEETTHGREGERWKQRDFRIGTKMETCLGSAVACYVISPCVELSSTLEPSRPFDGLYCMVEIDCIQTSLCLYK